jgi:hypothetical protein
MSPCKSSSFLPKPCIKFYAHWFNSKAQWRRPYGCEAIAGHDRTQSIHEPHQDSLFRVVIAVSHQHGAGMTHNLGGQEQESQPRLPRWYFSYSAVACSSRLKSISQQYKL